MNKGARSTPALVAVPFHEKSLLQPGSEELLDQAAQTLQDL